MEPYQTHSVWKEFIEALSQGITQDDNITGNTMLGQEHKFSLFADDIFIYLSNPESSILKLISFLDVFSSVSGYKVNIPEESSKVSTTGLVRL